MENDGRNNINSFMGEGSQSADVLVHVRNKIMSGGRKAFGQVDHWPDTRKSSSMSFISFPSIKKTCRLSSETILISFGTSLR